MSDFCSIFAAFFENIKYILRRRDYILIGLLLILLFVPCMGKAVNANYSYKHSLGATIGSFFGVEYKVFATPKCIVVTDLGFNLIASKLGTRKLGYTQAEFWVAQFNPNIGYQGIFAQNEQGTHSWFIGGGISIGLLTGYADYSLINGKAGANAMFGYEWNCSRIPIVISADFRPGYGLTFQNKFNQSFFDWALFVSVRRRF